jgi:hypothetical protein
VDVKRLDVVPHQRRLHLRTYHFSRNDLIHDYHVSNPFIIILRVPLPIIIVYRVLANRFWRSFQFVLYVWMVVIV